MRWFLGGLLALGITGMIALVIVASISDEAQTRAQQAQREVKLTREILTTNCERSSNPLRTGLRQDAELERYEALHPDPRVLRLLKLSDLSDEEIRSLTERKVQRLNYNIHVRYKPINCHARYAHTRINGE